MLDFLFRTAQRLKPEDIRMRGSTKTLVHFALVVFLRPSLFRKGYCPANGLLPNAVKVILGGPLTNEKLLMLPHDWRGSSSGQSIPTS